MFQVSNKIMGTDGNSKHRNA